MDKMDQISEKINELYEKNNIQPNEIMMSKSTFNKLAGSIFGMEIQINPELKEDEFILVKRIETVEVSNIFKFQNESNQEKDTYEMH